MGVQVTSSFQAVHVDFADVVDREAAGVVGHDLLDVVVHGVEAGDVQAQGVVRQVALPAQLEAVHGLGVEGRAAAGTAQVAEAQRAEAAGLEARGVGGVDAAGRRSAGSRPRPCRWSRPSRRRGRRRRRHRRRRSRSRRRSRRCIPSRPWSSAGRRSPRTRR